MIILPAPSPPAAPVDARQLIADTLTDIAVRLDTRRETVEALHRLLETWSFWKGGRLLRRTMIALIAAAYADSEQTAALLDDLATAATRLERHRDTTGHDECCGGEWKAEPRRDACENGPADDLWQKQDNLLHHVETLRSLPHLLRAAQDQSAGTSSTSACLSWLPRT